MKLTLSRTGVFGLAAANAAKAPVAPTWPATCEAVSLLIGNMLLRSLPNEVKNACVLALVAAMNAGSGTKRINWFALRMRVHSVELKKNSLSFLTGPPKEYPKILLVKTGFLTPLALFSGVLEARAETRLNSYPLP